MEQLKESQRNMIKMQNEMNIGLNKSMMEEFRISRIQNFEIRERLEKNNRGPEGRIEWELSQGTQHYCSGKLTKNKILPLIQKYVNDKDASVEAIQYEHINNDLTY